MLKPLSIVSLHEITLKAGFIWTPVVCSLKRCYDKTFPHHVVLPINVFKWTKWLAAENEIPWILTLKTLVTIDSLDLNWKEEMMRFRHIVMLKRRIWKDRFSVINLQRKSGIIQKSKTILCFTHCKSQVTQVQIDNTFYISTTWWVSLLVDQRVPEGTCSQVLRSTSADS